MHKHVNPTFENRNLNLRLKYIIGIILTSIIFSSCAIHGTFENRFNDEHGASWIKINSNSTFEYITWGHMTGYGYTKGSWEKVNNSISLTESEPIIPKTNQIIETKNGNKNINLIRKDGTPLFSYYLKLNGILVNKQSDWDGNYSYKKIGKISRIEIFASSENKIGQKVADFKTNCKTCSYKIIVDLKKVGFKSIYNLDSLWVFKNNRFYPINSAKQKLNKGKTRYYKKTDSIKLFSLWINSWNNMKNGFE